MYAKCKQDVCKPHEKSKKETPTGQDLEKMGTFTQDSKKTYTV